ncbi:MAG: tRNA (guanosine(46)-N7)-methyltransferase TrmB [Gammaproteobacteria bacterium]|nr:tRNA (guanosine(46)-N7)-methyltransferase TrmB [Gammaproteobacteria bacterium]
MPGAETSAVSGAKTSAVSSAVSGAETSAVSGAETSAVSGAVSGAETSAEFSADQCVSVGAASVGGECVSVGSMPSAVESSVSAPLDNSSAISFANVDVADKRQLPLRTYGRTHGRITRGQKRALTTLGGKYLLAFDGRPLGTSNSFAGAQDLILDLGCGMCDALAAMAARRAHERFIGIDVYEPGIARGCVLAEQAGLDNLRLVHHDMKEVLRDGIKPGSVKEIYVLFPDPWPKRRHQKRRLIQDEFAGLLHRVLRPNGLCCVATDWPEYADHITKVFASRTDFVTTPVTADALQAATATKFHRRGVNLGHPVSCLCWTAI